MKYPEWTRGVEPIFRSEGDGQGYQFVYARSKGGGWTYVVMMVSDDEIPREVWVLENGMMERFEVDG